jgi:hypothetical protein
MVTWQHQRIGPHVQTANIQARLCNAPPNRRYHRQLVNGHCCLCVCVCVSCGVNKITALPSVAKRCQQFRALFTWPTTSASFFTTRQQACFVHCLYASPRALPLCCCSCCCASRCGCPTFDPSRCCCCCLGPSTPRSALVPLQRIGEHYHNELRQHRQR